MIPYLTKRRGDDKISVDDRRALIQEADFCMPVQQTILSSRSIRSSVSAGFAHDLDFIPCRLAYLINKGLLPVLVRLPIGAETSTFHMVSIELAFSCFSGSRCLLDPLHAFHSATLYMQPVRDVNTLNSRRRYVEFGAFA